LRQADGKLIIFGNFTSYLGGTRNRIARLNADGTLDATFTPGTGANNAIFTAAFQADGKILIGGVFTSYNGTTRNRIARLNADGSLDATFNPVSGANGTVLAVAIQPDGKIVIGGPFTSYDGVSRIRLARLNANGTLDTTSDSGIVNNFRFGIRRLMLTADNQILVGGSFATYNGVARNSIAKLRLAPLLSKTPFDYDGDGKTDVSIWRPSDGLWYIIQSGLQSMSVRGWGNNGDKPVPADFDGDGKTDLAVWRPSDSNWYIINSATSTVSIAGWGVVGDQFVPADYSGDGKADIAIFRPSEGKWYRRDSDGAFNAYEWGAPGDKPAPADFNGDGVADMTVFRPSEGKWYTINSGTAAITVGFWGVPGDVPVPGDYSGDGKADFVIYRPSNHNWYRMHTDNNSIHIITWGTDGDLPVPGDYDGDGRQDLAIFRPTDSTWWIFGSTSGIYSQPFGQTGDIPTPNAFVY
jgi:uncharacterized delta-60 repeat protein